MSKIKCESLEDDDVYIPKNWKIENTYKKLLNDTILKNNKLIEKYITLKNDNNISNVFSRIINIIKHQTTNIHNIIGGEHIYNCKGEIDFYSKFTNENASQLLQLIFIILFKNIINYNNFTQPIQSKLSAKIVNPSDDLEIVIGVETAESTIGQTVEPSNDPSNEYNLLEDIEETNTTQQKIIVNLLYDILSTINESQEHTDKHTQSHMNEVIDKQYDTGKEESLKFVETLDKESRQSLNTMISLGLVTWKNLDKRDDNELYFDTPDEETTPTDVAELSGTIYNDEEQDVINRDRARETLGDDFSDETYQEWLDQHNSGVQEEHDALTEHVMVDDDGDFQGDDDYGDDY